MARKKAVGLTPAGARTDIPTDDGEDFVDPASGVPKRVRYERDPSLDPQLMWRGKDGRDSSNLIADAPPIYIQEKIEPLLLIGNLLRAAGRPEGGPDGLSRIESYRHPPNWANRMILGDSLNAMASLAERESLRGKVQMIYVDPPYGIRFGPSWQVSARKRDVGDARAAGVAREAERVKAFRDTWELGIHSYLAHLRDRLVVARDLLTESGSCFVQIGDENVHLVRCLMDEVFGGENFVSQISFAKTTGFATDLIPNVADHLLWYGRFKPATKYRPMFVAATLGGPGAIEYTRAESADGRIVALTKEQLAGNEPVSRDLRPLTTGDVTSAGGAAADLVLPSGRKLAGKSGVHWKTTPEGMNRLEWAGRLMPTGRFRIFKRFFDDFPYVVLTNQWLATRGEAGKVYVVQTSRTVVERCVLMTTDPGDLVLDPTCGSGTTAFVAEQWGRRWITIDTSRVALALARQRLMGARFPYYLLSDSKEGRRKEAELTGKPASREPVTDDIRHGFVYERVRHITLKSIANNPDIKEGMTREEIDDAIKRHAGYEYLYDKPYEDKGRVRVSGRFTVESLSPHRSSAFPGATIGEPAADSLTFERSILDNVAKAGIQNGRRRERIEFASVDAYAGSYMRAVGECGGGTRIGLAIGPRYGTVSAGFIEEATREAVKAGDIDLLCVLAFAFDPQATGATVDAPREGFAVLMVRMNADLLMGEDLKKTGSANLFTVFGEPDFDARETDDGSLVIDLQGVDVYDPTTGTVRRNDTGQIALWMIDTNYDGTSFVVRHCYFTGGDDPYKRLKTALRADIRPDAWSALYRTVSIPFEPPETGRVAVKVINDYGDEVIKVFTV